MASLPSVSTVAPAPCSWRGAAAAVQGKRLIFSSHSSRRSDSMKKFCGFEVRAFFPNPTQEQPILKEALKEPVAFVGGIFAGLLRLDLNEDPLKEWVTRTVEASGISAEEISKSSENEEGEEETPQQIEIE